MHEAILKKDTWLRREGGALNLSLQRGIAGAVSRVGPRLRSRAWPCCPGLRLICF